MAVSVEFQKQITDLVEESGIKRSELPNKMGIDYRSFSNALNYGIIPKPRILVRIADYFNIPLRYLLGQTEDDSFNKAPCSSNFNARLFSLCQEKDITYYKVSKDCHFDKSYISRWINKNYLPSLEIIDLLCDYFDVSPDYLLGRTDDKN